jgi:hypothetical protein
MLLRMVPPLPKAQAWLRPPHQDDGQTKRGKEISGPARNGG